MSTRCEYCGRATAQTAIVPYWFPYTDICDRRKCRRVVRDATEAVLDERERHKPLVGAIKERHEAQGAPVGYRQDAMSAIDVIDEEDWWATNVAKVVDV